MRFLIIFFGANDACLKGAKGSQHVPLEKYEQNLANIISHPKVQAQNPRIIVVTPPPINEYGCEENDRAKGYLEPRRNANHTKQYAEVAKKAALANGAILLDLYTVLMNHAEHQEGDAVLEGSKEKPDNPFLKMLLHDGRRPLAHRSKGCLTDSTPGLHFTHTAYTLFFQELMRTIHKTWPDQMPSELPFVLPEWNNEQAWEPSVFDQ